MHTGRAFERLISFTDAVVAVAITLLILPIIDIRGTADETSVWAIMADHSSELITFGFTFVVVAIMWRTHNRVFNRMRAFDETVFWLNLLWLAAVVFLPWASALFGEGIGIASNDGTETEGMGGAGALYWMTLVVISGSGALMAAHVNRRPAMLENPDEASSKGAIRGFAFAAVFALIAVASLFFPVLASWLPLALIPISVWINVRAGKSEAEVTD